MAVFKYVGTSGNDTFSVTAEGSSGTADGLAGFDTAIIGHKQSAFIVSTSTTGVVTLATTSGKVLQFTNFEKIKFSDGSSIGVGSAGNDTVDGATGVDSLWGLAGNDTLNGMAGADKMLGGAGNDTYIVDNVSDKVYETTTMTSTTDAGGVDLVKSSVSYTLGNYVENLVLTGTAAINGTGNALANKLSGNNAANSLNGGDGNDLLNGAGGNDTLTGGTGLDKFLFASTPGSGNVDTITDFGVGGVRDKILLDDDFFKALGVVGTTQGVALGAGSFYAGKAAHDADDRIIYDQTTGSLYYDADGNGAGAAVKIAVIGTATHAALQASDFLVVA